jgi:hypothetical protein
MIVSVDLPAFKWKSIAGNSNLLCHCNHLSVIIVHFWQLKQYHTLLLVSYANIQQN